MNWKQKMFLWSGVIVIKTVYLYRLWIYVCCEASSVYEMCKHEERFNRSLLSLGKANHVS
jgi:hypothetical protein